MVVFSAANVFPIDIPIAAGKYRTIGSCGTYAASNKSQMIQIHPAYITCCGIDMTYFCNIANRLQFRCRALLSHEEEFPRRQFVVRGTVIPIFALLNLTSDTMQLRAWAGEESNDSEDNDESVVGALKSFFDPNEKTQSGKVLPKAYLKSAREVARTIRESLKEDTKDMAKFRRTADAAKESIREYLNGWMGQKTVVNEESYVLLEKAIRSLASFYSKAGPSATLPEDVKAEILSNLTTAEEYM